MLKLLFIVLKSIGTSPLYVLSFFVPKKRGLWVFGSWYGKKYADNTKYFFEFCETKKSDNYWIVKDKLLLKSLKNRNVNALYYLSLKGLWIQMRAEKAFITQSVMVDLMSPAINRTIIVQLWHGLALKKIMHDVKKSNKMRRFESLMSHIFPFSMHRQDFAIATSCETRKIFASAFKLPVNNVLITGLPRNDKLFDQINIGDSQSKGNKFNFIYMPTFRGGIGSEVDLFYRFNFDIDRISKILDENNATLTLRLHPVNRPTTELLDAISHKNNINFSTEDDIYEEISKYDCLITDFSSIYLDYILTGKPIIFSPFGLNDYIENDRELYYDYKSATLPYYCYDWVAIEKAIYDVVNDNIPTYYVEKYRDLIEKFHNAENKSEFCKKLYLEVVDLK